MDLLTKADLTKPISFDYGTNDLAIWLYRFWTEGKGHFVSEEGCINYISQVKQYIDLNGDVTAKSDEFFLWLENFCRGGQFVSDKAAMHMIGQIKRYLNSDGCVRSQDAINAISA